MTTKELIKNLLRLDPEGTQEVFFPVQEGYEMEIVTRVGFNRRTGEIVIS